MCAASWRRFKSNWVLTRGTDADTTSELSSGIFFFVEQGTVNADSGWVMTHGWYNYFWNNCHCVWSQFSGAGQITAGNGLNKKWKYDLMSNVGTGIALVSDECSLLILHGLDKLQLQL